MNRPRFNPPAFSTSAEPCFAFSLFLCYITTHAIHPLISFQVLSITVVVSEAHYTYWRVVLKHLLFSAQHILCFHILCFRFFSLGDKPKKSANSYLICHSPVTQSNPL